MLLTIYIVSDSYWHEWNILQMNVCGKEEVKVVSFLEGYELPNIQEGTKGTDWNVRGFCIYSFMLECNLESV